MNLINLQEAHRGGFSELHQKDCVLELFYGVDYHSHLGTEEGRMAACRNRGFCRAIHNIENAPFRTKFDRDVDEMKSNLESDVFLISTQPLL